MSRIFLNGDSITYGYWDDKSGGWGDRLKASLMQQEGYAHELMNFACALQTIDKIVKRFPEQLAPYGRARSLGILALGGADSAIRYNEKQPNTPLPQFRKLLTELGKVLVASRVTPIFIGGYPIDEAKCNPTPNGHSFTNARAAQYHEMIEDFANAIEAPFVALDELYQLPMDEFLSFDGIHPNARGHEIIAREVAITVRNRLTQPLLTYNN